MTIRGDLCTSKSDQTGMRWETEVLLLRRRKKIYGKDSMIVTAIDIEEKQVVDEICIVAVVEVQSLCSNSVSARYKLLCFYRSVP